MYPEPYPNAETCYAQIKKELLAIGFMCEHFELFTKKEHRRSSLIP